MPPGRCTATSNRKHPGHPRRLRLPGRLRHRQRHHRRETRPAGHRGGHLEYMATERFSNDEVTYRAESTQPSTPPPSDTQGRLLRLLPSGYPPGRCTPQSRPMPGALVSVKCGPNTDPNGPTIAAYGLYSDLKVLQDAFNGFTGSVSIVSCPGGKASPGTCWHTNDPNTILGQLACGIYTGSEPQVMWSNQLAMQFALVGGKPPGPSLDRLYKW
jgi:serine/threonine kinase PknH